MPKVKQDKICGTHVRFWQEKFGVLSNIWALPTVIVGSLFQFLNIGLANATDTPNAGSGPDIGEVEPSFANAFEI